MTNPQVERQQTELRFQTYTGEGVVLDEVVCDGLVHVENLSDTQWHFGGPGLHLNIYLDWLPRALWWDEIKDAWRSRDWPCFHTIRIQVISADHVKATIDGSELKHALRKVRQL